MKRPLAAFAIVVGILALDARAQAQGEPPEAGFGDKGHFALGAERLFGYVHGSQEEKTTIGTTSTTTTRTLNSISVLGSPIHNVASIFSFPRVGFDAFIASSVSLGGSLTYFHLSQSGNGDSITASGFLIAPRIGFAARLGQSVWLWPRVGVSYVSLTIDGGGGTSQDSNLFAATVEAPLALALAPRAILLVGPTLDLSLSGSTKIASPVIAGGPNESNDIKETDIALQVSFLFYL
jgi:hypothetical protein